MDVREEAVPVPPTSTTVNRPGVIVKYVPDGVETIQDIIVNKVKNKKKKKNPREI